SLRATGGGDPTTEPDTELAVAVAAALSDAQALLRRELADVQAAPELPPSSVDFDVLMGRWRLLRRGDAQLRMSVHLALQDLDHAEASQPLRVTKLGAAFSDYLVADQVVADAWTSLRATKGATGLDDVACWLRRLLDAREVVELAVVGP